MPDQKGSLQEKYPIIARMADGWDPSIYMPGSHAIKNWRCSKGHSFKTEIRYLVKKIRDRELCLICNGRVIQIGVNDLATTHPLIASEAWGWDPTTVTRGSNRKRKFKCPAGHIYETMIATRALEGRGCRICKNQQVVKGFNDLATKFPQIAEEADGWDASNFVFGSSKRMNWKCRKGHRWSATIIGRTQGEKGCPFCSGFRTWSGFNDIATTHPHLATEAEGWDPKKIHAGTNKKLTWKCSAGHIWQASGTSRSANGSGCPYCANFKCLSGFNDISTTHPELVSEAFGWDPSTVIAGSNKIMSWQCSKGHIWRASVVNRAYGKRTGCPECATSGFKPEQDAWVYLLRDRKRGLHQIGITNDPDQRVSLHKTRGWTVIDLIGPMKGKEAKNIEDMVLALLWRRSIWTGARAGLRKFDGYTESWKSSEFSPQSLIEIVGETNLNHLPRK